MRKTFSAVTCTVFMGWRGVDKLGGPGSFGCCPTYSFGQPAGQTVKAEG